MGLLSTDFYVGAGGKSDRDSLWEVSSRKVEHFQVEPLIWNKSLRKCNLYTICLIDKQCDTIFQKAKHPL